VASDPDDDKIIEAAVVGKADAIVSGDHHLLDLVAVEGIPVLSVRQFLERLRLIP
jgi:predicted nucleic acid-binding protein